MATAANIISRALRILGVMDPTEAPEAEDFQTAIVALNAMGARWEASGLIESWTELVRPEDEVSAPVTAYDALCYGLAARLRPEYGLPIAEDVLAMAQQATSLLWRDRLAGPVAGEVGRVILRALRLLSGNGVSTFPDGFTLSGAIATLNAMMARWEANGMALGWSSVDGPSDSLPVPPEAEDAVAHNLAMRLAPEYGVEPRMDVATAATEGIAALRRDRLVSNPLEMRSRLGLGPRYNMITDQYE